MQALEPEILIPGHGPVVFGARRADQMLGDTASVLEEMVQQTVGLMNSGATLNQILHTVKGPERARSKPYLVASYDEPEFVVRGIWHLYAGWFDGNPAHLKPARDHELAVEIAALAGGADKLAERAAALADSGQTREALQLVEFASNASPTDKAIQAIRARVLAKCIEAESSLMGKNILGAFQRDAQRRASA
jgi:alkyl sulfatase BDS1-like metallo-beta-lactamase superfamily hydrolase